MRFAAALLALALAVSGASHADATPHAISASGPLAVLNGLAAVELKAVAPMPLGIPAPAGHVTLFLHSTFGPPKPRAVTVSLWCTAVESDPSGVSFYGSGRDSDERPWFVRLHAGEVLWEFGWSTAATHGPCGAAGLPTVPLIGAAVITP